MKVKDANGRSKLLYEPRVDFSQLAIEIENDENIRWFDEIETIHLQNENKIYKGELQTYTSKSKSEIKRHFKQFKNMARFMALTSHHRHHHDDHIKKISMHDEFVNSHDFPKIDRYLSESYSTIAENFRGNVHIPNAQTYIQNNKLSMDR